MNEVLHAWNNGNTKVTLYTDGTKTREYEDNVIPEPEFPETIDMKITNWCNAPCQKWCHEMSNVKGNHASFVKMAETVADAPKGMEIAFGGGATQTWPYLSPMVEALNYKGVICNMTVNQYHIQAVETRILRKFKGIGISYQSHMEKYILQDTFDRHNHVVIHLIMGVHKPKDLLDIAALNPKARFLLLGYKNWGNGSRYMSLNDLAIKKCLQEWYIAMAQFIRDYHIGFDNLAIEQMKLSRLFTPEGWKKFFMGDEGTFSMYVDMVKEEYASHSTSPNRYPIEPGMGIRDMFQKIKERKLSLA